MSLLGELLLGPARPILRAVLWVFGYDEDWEPIRSDRGGRPRALSAFFCFAVSGLVLAGLIWMACLLSR